MKKETLKKIKENTVALDMILKGLNTLQRNMVSKELKKQLLITRKFFQQLIYASMMEMLVLKDKDEFNGIIKNLKKELENGNEKA